MDPRTPVGITPERAAEVERLKALGADLSPGVRSDLGASAPDRRAERAAAAKIVGSIDEQF